MKMKKFLVFLLVAILAMTTLVGCGPKEVEDTDVGQTDLDKPEDTPQEEPAEEVELLVSAAASLTDVLEDIKSEYKKVSPETELKFTFGPSGGLQTQIEEGAPVDVFMSAAEKQMDALEEGGLLVNDTRKTLLINNVVLITPKDGELDISSFDDMTKDEVKKIGIGDPANVPVGQYSEEIFESLEIKDAINDRLILGTDVRTVLTWVETGEVDLGLVYETDAMTSSEVNIVTKAPEGSHKEVTYPVATIKDSKNIEASNAFLDFLSTDVVKGLFEKYGFTVK